VRRGIALGATDGARRRLLGALAAAGVVVSGCNNGAQALRRVGWLTLVQNYGAQGNWALNAFREKLAELGWVEGRNIVIEPRWAENQQDRLALLAEDLVRLPVDVIVAQTNAATIAAKKATRTIPIVMTGTSEPDRVGIVDSLARPGGNITGLTDTPGLGFVSKMMQLLKDAAPSISRVATINMAPWRIGELRSSAARLGVEVVDIEAPTPEDVPVALASALHAGATAVIVLSSTVTDPNRRRIADFALSHRWPSIGGDRAFVEAGGLMSYWTDWTEIRRMTAVYVDKILRGAKPEELPIERPKKFQLVINLRTAKLLDADLPMVLRLSADEVID
jgi:putative tryptophan/tyrosine transport system substrate-binding protein